MEDKTKSANNRSISNGFFVRQIYFCFLYFLCCKKNNDGYQYTYSDKYERLLKNVYSYKIICCLQLLKGKKHGIIIIQGNADYVIRLLHREQIEFYRVTKEDRL